jgi:geranylgeranyl pyrophosphate synthase
MFTIEKAYAKINLMLDVVKKREDGFHDILTIMQVVDLYDKVCISLNNTGKIEVVVNNCDIDIPMEKNLAYIAARKFMEKLDFDTLLKLHSKKTGALIIAAAKLGCIAAGVDDNDPRYNAAIEFARAIGLAFQIIDDILDATSSLEQLGKNVGVDKDRNKTTFLSFMTIEAANEYARELTDKAKAELSVFNNNEMLCELADYLLTREK